MSDDVAGEKSEVIQYNTAPPVTEHERELGYQAQTDFDKGDYDSCLKTLNKVLTSRTTDAKVLHNTALVEYCKSGLKKTDEFLKGLHDVCEKCQVNLQDVNNLDDVDYCVIYYNYALLLFHTKQYQNALTLLDKLFQFIEPLEENLRRKVLFLMVELYLATQQPEKAHAILNFTEKNLFGNGNKSQQPTPEKDKERESRDTPPDTTSANEVWRPKISQYKVRCYLMLKSVKACKREIKTLMSAVGLGSQLVYLKSNFEYLRANYRKTIKLLNTAPKPESEDENLATMYYNNLGCIHFHMQKHHLGAFYFKKAIAENDNACMNYSKLKLGQSLSGPRITSLSMSRHNELTYNLAVQLLHCNKLDLAFECMLKVIDIYYTNPRLWLRMAECCIQTHRQNNEEDRDLSRRMEVVTGSLGSGLHRKLILGSGQINKYRRRYEPGESSAVPALTLEFAMLCLKNALYLLPEDKSQSANTANANAANTGSCASTSGGSSSGSGASTGSNWPGSTSSGSNVPGAVPVPEDGEQSKPYDAPIPSPPGNPIRGQEISNLKCSILCHSAYVSLCLNDYLLAAKYAERLLQQPKLSGAHRYVGSMYLAEAYVALDRIADAIHHLVPEQVQDLSISVPDASKQEEKGAEHESYESRGCPVNWSPRDVTRARAIMQFNLATAHAVRGENEKALRNLASSANQIGAPFPAQIYYLMLYLDLVDGKRKRAQQVIKDQFGHITSNRA